MTLQLSNSVRKFEISDEQIAVLLEDELLFVVVVLLLPEFGLFEPFDEFKLATERTKPPSVDVDEVEL